MFDEILENGYKEYPVNSFVKCDKFFQKRFRDEKGTKYFIDIEYFEHQGILEPSFEYVVYFTVGEDNRAIRIRLYSGWSLTQVEEFVEKMWKTKLYNYYEKDEE